LYKHFGLTAESVAKTVRQCIWKKNQLNQKTENTSQLKLRKKF
jgi:hypothetical protein